MADLSQIQIIPAQVERPVTSGDTTLRGGYTNLSYNQNLLKRLNAVVDKEFKGDLNFFDDESRPVPSIEYLQQLLSQVVIRFDNDPDYYTKRDYYYLIWYLCQSLVYLSGPNADLANIKTLIDQLEQDLSGKQDKQDFDLATVSKTVVGAINELNTSVTNLKMEIGTENMYTDHAKTITGAIQEINLWRGQAQEDIDHLQGDKQSKTDVNLNTNDKTIVGAINEVRTQVLNNHLLIHGGKLEFEYANSSSEFTKNIAHLLPAGKYKISANSSISSNIAVDPFGIPPCLIARGNQGVVDYRAIPNNMVIEVEFKTPVSLEFSILQKDFLDVVYDPITQQFDFTKYDPVSQYSFTAVISDIWVLPAEGTSLTEGSSIDIVDDTISAVVDQDITVTVATGSYASGEKIEAGTDITTVLQKLLTTVIGVVPTVPTITLTGKSKTEEYGTKIPQSEVVVNLLQGYFSSADTSKWATNQQMNCKLEFASVNNAEAFVLGDDSSGYCPVSEVVLTSPITFSVANNRVSANTDFPENNLGETLTDVQGFAGGQVKSSGTVTYTPYYNAFIGGIDVESISELTSANIRSVAAHQLPVTPTAKTLLNGQPTSNGAKKAILIACPSVYKLTSVQSELGTDMTDSFDLKGSVNVKCGEETVSYNCYLCVVHGECKFQTVKLGKA